MHRISILLLILCACFEPVASGQNGENWSQFHRDDMARYNPSDVAISVHNVGSLAEMWNYQTGSAVYSSPAVVNGVVYVGSEDQNIYALDANTGAVIWSYLTGYAVYSSPAVDNGVVYVGALYYVYALDASTGTLIWNYPTGGLVQSSPAVANGIVYVGGGDGYLYALNTSTGTLLWRNPATGDTDRLPWQMGWSTLAREKARCSRWTPALASDYGTTQSATPCIPPPQW